MSYFRQLGDKLPRLLSLLKKDETWLIMINADPDAMASAMALKRILSRRVRSVAIGQINIISRPDNLAMIRYLRIPTHEIRDELAEGFDRYALVDSQPAHNPDFAGFRFSIIIDHHPMPEGRPPEADFVEIKPEYGATATLLTEYLYNLKITPSRLLATALLYGIKSDTQDFEREFCDTDIKAFRYLSKFADHTILRKVVRSEYHLSWLKHFSWAFRNLVLLPHGIFVHMHAVKNPDILVVLADFFLRVHEVTWAVISGIYDGKLVIIFRGDGLNRHVGELAKNLFGDVGSAGGHKAAARAEIPLEALAGAPADDFVLERIDPNHKRRSLPLRFMRAN